MKNELYKYKKMEYKELTEYELLARGEMLGYNFYIINYGTHPCCYIELPKEHKYYGKDYDDIDVSVHGGLTYAKKYLKDFVVDDSWVIGWDYAHAGDYMGFYKTIQDYISKKDLVDFLKSGKKWSTQELLDDVFKVVTQLETQK